ncbi:MAG TPA: protein translocase subunit SecD [Planctomycetes bacterium]|nr:protein translocase subunit SecD [Planctomycetota bacterium]
MGKKITWKVLLIVFLASLAAWNVYPPKDKLKLGLDLAGGTSLVYQIDTRGLERAQRKDLAQRMIPILLRRIDPTNVANIVMRPQGDTRIEIQLPVASAETRKKRQAYEKALEELEKTNANLLTIRSALSADEAQRQKVFSEFAGDSVERREILENLASAYDARKAKQAERDDLASKLSQVRENIKSAGLQDDFVEAMAPQWSKLEKEARTEAITRFLEQNEPGDIGLVETVANLFENKKKLIEEYVDSYSKWAGVVNELAEPETGLNAQYDQAVERLSELNLSIAQLTDVLELPTESAQRQTQIDDFVLRFPKREEKINAVISAFDEYRRDRGRLDDPEDLKRMLKGAGVLEFRILPTSNDGKVTTSELEGYKEALRTKGPKQALGGNYVWCQIEDVSNFPTGFRDIGQPAIGTFGDKYYVLASNRKNECMLRGTGTKEWKLRRAYPTTDSKTGRRAIGFDHDEVAAGMFYTVTNNNIGRPLCILLDGEAISAPVINDAIRSSGVITGDFTETEVTDMVNKLNAGSFPARLSEVPISEKSIGATIGADNRDQGIRAGLIGLAAVAVFMLVYYLLAGSIADVALLMNILFVLGMMAVFRATFTLPGIAAIILTIGMSVDANVLIFERIREEQQRGSSLRTAIATGYQRAFRAIFDANVTTFITALILFMVASEEIKGFAIVLMLGIASSMFTALFVTRAIFDFLVAKRIVKEHLLMLRLVRNPQVNWMGLKGVFFAISLALIAGGMGVFFFRSDTENSKYDIEFTGGTSIQLNLKDGTDLTRSDVEKRIREKGEQLNNPGLKAAKVYSIGRTQLQYEITTTETNETRATITFNEPGKETVESVKNAIERTAENESVTLYNLSVGKKGQDFVVSTSQVNRQLVRDILNKAFAPGAEVSEPVVNEIVSRALRESFADQLDVRENLGASIAAVEKVTETDVELADFLGGIKISCNLQKPTTYEDLATRFKDIRFKPDMQELVWYSYKLLSEELTEPAPGDTINSFVYVSVHPEAGYRELTDDEFNRFVENERAKIINAASLQTSLARVTQIDPSIGAQSKTRALVAIILSLAAIVAYIWIRFGTARYGFAAIAALVHDVCITLGAVTACTYLASTGIGKTLLIGDFKINLEMIAAFLTIIGYSLNDTIVVFDRIRENRGKSGKLNEKMISDSINQTLSRTLLTSMTTFMVVLVMYIWGGAGLRGFTFAMLIGILIGTYSSVAIAAPILLLGSKTLSSK